MRWFSFFLIIVFYVSIESSSKGLLGPDDVFVTMHFLLDSRVTCVFQALKENLILHLIIDPATNTHVSVQMVSPSKRRSLLVNGNGSSAYLRHNTTESGDYEFCIFAPSSLKVLYHMYAYDPKARPERKDLRGTTDSLNTSISTITNKAFLMEMELKFSNQVSVRDVNLQLKNSAFIVRYVVGFCCSAIIVAILQVVFVRRLFHINPSRIRI
ncbi:hypothetical protein GCK32_008982 [Trichostrongylus colubriformis]|uniref:GOLD domain-containing protein n=1 Tax=Trichostrongylus colubriformis TaxID=6319 RepID=A0AAN8FB62_TRICO